MLSFERRFPFLHLLNECVNRIHLKFIEENWGGVKKKKKTDEENHYAVNFKW